MPRTTAGGARANPTRAGLALLLAVMLCSLSMPARGADSAPPTEPPMLSVQGRHLVDPSGHVVTLRGCNLGNWFLIEPWMFGIADDDPRSPHDQYGFMNILESRFGPDAAARLLDIHRQNWITARDMQVIRSFGFNAVRLPFHYSLLEDDAHPGKLRPDAFRWLDHAVDLCRDAGLYVILDMHGVPGGQSVDAPTGRSGQNKLWTNPDMQRRTAHLWAELARHYRDNPTIAAYDIINEPYGDFASDHSPALVHVAAMILDAIRPIDPDRLVYLPGTIHGIDFYADPRARNWHNAGFTEHFYPGVFAGEPASLETHAGFFASTVAERKRYLDALDVPYLIGEFNPVYRRVGGPLATRDYFDAFAHNGWAATIWSYRVLTPEGGIRPDTWALATNAHPARIDLFHDSEDQLAATLASASTAPLAVYTELRDELTSGKPPHFSFAERPPVACPPADPSPGWTPTDIATPTQGSQVTSADRTISVIASGADIFADRDTFRFVSRDAPESFALTCTLRALDARHRYAKAGLMLRASTDPGSPHVLIHAFPDGKIVLAHRTEPAGPTVERTLATVQPPVGLGIERLAGRIVVRYTDAAGIWRDVPIDPAYTPHELRLVGFAVTSHAEGAYARADFSSVRFDTTDAPPRRPATLDRTPRAHTTNLLDNASFERAGDDARPGAWPGWGPDLRRETGWTPTRESSAILAFHHWESTTTDNSGVWQDVAGLTPGERYRFSIAATSDAVPAGRLPFAAIELRLEAEHEGMRLTLASRTYRHTDLLASPAWNELAVEAAAPGDTVRALIVVTPAPGPHDQRAGALKLDTARLEPVATASVPAVSLRVARQFADHMVLQRERPIPVFGTAPAGTPVTVELAGARASATTDESGRWRAELPAMPAGGPHRLRVRAHEPANEIVLDDILVGDVWFASGQSNMEWPLGDAERAHEWLDLAPSLDTVRLYRTPRDLAPLPLDEPRAGRWERPDDAREWSAVGFHFARLMADATGVPVGIVESAWGGSPIRSWTPAPDGAVPDAWVSDDPLLRRALFERNARAFDEAFDAWMDNPVPDAVATATDAWQSIRVPGVWETTAIGPVDGVVWVCRSFDVPADAAGEGATLELGTIDDFDRTYINGALVGQTSRDVPEPWQHPRVYRVPAGVLRPGVNHLAVQVLDTGGGGGLYGDPGRVRLTLVGRPTIPLAGEWRARVVRELAPGSFPRAALDAEPNFGVPSGMHNAMVAPWARVPVRGMLWYQGESDTDHPRAYADALRTLIETWRTEWGEPDAPFLYVQLPNFMPERDTPSESAWAELRRSQAAVLAVARTGMAVTIDIGDPNDIHPRHKEEVARRLSLLARRAVFGEDVVADPPAPTRAARRGGSVVITFDGAIVADGLASDLARCFAVAGPDGRFVWASAAVSGREVVLTSPAGSSVERVRYAWADNPRAPVFGATGLPVAPFELAVRAREP